MNVMHLLHHGAPVVGGLALQPDSQLIDHLGVNSNAGILDEAHQIADRIMDRVVTADIDDDIDRKI